MMKKRLISLLLIAAMLTSAAAMNACSKNASGDEETAAAASAETSVESAETSEEAAEPEKDELDAREDVSDDLPEMDFGGRTYTIAGDEQYESYYTAEEMTGEVVNDAVYLRNTTISDRFNVQIAAVPLKEDTICTNVSKSILAGDEAYQLMAGHIIYLGKGVTSKIMYNMRDLPYIDYSKPWWSDSTVNDLTYKGMTFIAIGDFALSAIGATYCMYYNKDMGANFNLPDMYKLVNDGEWTIDKQFELSEGIYEDSNGNGEKDENDLYALSTSTRTPTCAYLWAFGKNIATQQPDGTYAISYFDEKTVSIMEKLYHLYYETDYAYYDVTSWDSLITFMPGRALFGVSTVDASVSLLREVEFNYGIIPYPKWDTVQDKYYTNADGGHEGLCVPKGLSDPEFSGLILEALCAESWKKTLPAYYDIALKHKGARDYDSLKMIDLIVDGRVFDFGYVYGYWGPGFWFQSLLENNSKDITSHYEKNRRAFEATMDLVFKAFEEYTAEYKKN